MQLHSRSRGSVDLLNVCGIMPRCMRDAAGVCAAHFAVSKVRSFVRLDRVLARVQRQFNRRAGLAAFD